MRIFCARFLRKKPLYAGKSALTEKFYKFLDNGRIYAIMIPMSKDIKKIIWCVVYGIALVSIVTGFVSLLINMVTFLVYDSFHIEGLGQILDERYQNQLRIYLAVSAGLALLYLGLLLLKIPFHKNRYMVITFQWISFVVTLGMLAVACVTAVSTFSLPSFSEKQANSVDVNALSYFLDAFALILQCLVSAALLLAAERILMKAGTSAKPDCGQKSEGEKQGENMPQA